MLKKEKKPQKTVIEPVRLCAPAPSATELGVGVGVGVASDDSDNNDDNDEQRMLLISPNQIKSANHLIIIKSNLICFRRVLWCSSFSPGSAIRPIDPSLSPLDVVATVPAAAASPVLAVAHGLPAKAPAASPSLSPNKGVSE